MTDEKADELKKDIQIEPFIELPIQALKVKRNLWICTILSFGALIGGHVKSDPSGMSFRIEGLPMEYAPHLLLGMTVYCAIYFFLLGKQTITIWRLRQTATSRMEKNKGKRTMLDATDDYGHSQETVIKYFKTLNEKVIESMESIVENLQGYETTLNSHASNRAPGNTPPGNTYAGKLEDDIRDFQSAVDRFNEKADITSRFEKKFFSYQNSLILNWIIEYYLPLASAGAVSLLLFCKLICFPELVCNALGG